MQNRIFPFSLRAKLYFSFTCVVAALCVGVAVTRYLSDQLAENLENITGNVIPVIRSLHGINAASLGIAESASTLFYAAQRESDDQQKVIARERAEFLGARDQLREVRRTYFTIVPVRPVQHQYAGELRELIEQLDKTSAQLMEVVDRKGSTDRGLKVISKLEELTPKIALVTGLAIDLETAALRERKEQAEASIRDVVRLVAAVLLLSMGIGGGVGVGFYGSLFDSIVRLRRAAEAVGSGALSTRIEKSSGDEIGSVITAFNQMAARLESTTISRTFLESVLDSLLEAVVVVDSSGWILNVNAAFYRFTGVPPGDAKSMQIDSILNGITMEQIMKDSKPSGHPQLFLLSANGEQIVISLAWAPLFEADGQPRHWVLVARDIRETQKAEADLRSYREQLDRAQQLAALGSVSALLAHKVNQPLTVIQLLLQQSLRNLDRTDVVRSKITESLAEAKLLNTTLKEVLRYTRPTDAQFESNVVFYEIAEKLCTAFDAAARDAGITLEYELLRGAPVVRGVEAEYEEMFFILIENAIHAAPKSRPSRLAMSVSRDDENVYLYFADTCSGIAKENLDRVFDLFFTTKPRSQGTGLGLGIFKQLISARGGDITVESTLGERTCFTVRIPLRFTAIKEFDWDEPSDLLTDSGVSGRVLE